jgi:cytochrome P450
VGDTGGIMEEQETGGPPAPPTRAQTLNSCASFNIAAMHTHTAFYAVFNWLTDYPQREWWMWFFRQFWPIFRVPFVGLVIVFRDEDVREVLAHDQEFPVPWDKKMMKLSGDKDFVLGMADGPEYRRNYEQLAKAFRREDVATDVVPLAAKTSADILRDTRQIDVMRDLIWRVPSQLCEDYYGIEIPDKLLLAEWTMAMSSYLFGSASKDSTSGKDLAMSAADGFLKLIRGAIEKTRNGDIRGVVLQRLIEMQKSDPAALPDDVLEAHLFGMVTGFVPTNLLAGGNLLMTLLRRKDFMAAARAAALADDDDLLWRCLREAMRFRNFSLGPFRICGRDGYKLAASTWRAEHLAADTGILASTQSAMFDSRRITRPWQFDPQRAAEDYLVFGYGQHSCLGSYIAIAQITQTFKALLRKPGLRPAQGAAGRLQTITVFPAHLTLEFDA